MAEIKLLPCPFCEGPPVLITYWIHDTGRREMHESPPLPSDDGVMYGAQIFCHECGAEGPSNDGLICEKWEIENIERRGAELWNRRDASHRYLYDAGEARGSCVYPDRRTVDGRDDDAKTR